MNTESEADARADAPRSQGRRPWWQHPALLSLALALLILVGAFVPAFWGAVTGYAPAASSAEARADAPWQARADAGGALRVMGLQLPGSRLADAQAQWGEDLQLALMMSRDGTVALEASVERAQPGGVSGRVVLSAEVDDRTLARWREAAGRERAVSAETWRLELVGPWRDEALQAPLHAMAFIPAAQLDAEVLRQRFGAPQERLKLAGETAEHWLYPAQGLAIALDDKARELLQWVPMAQFDKRLRAPLLEAGAQPVP